MTRQTQIDVDAPTHLTRCSPRARSPAKAIVPQPHREYLVAFERASLEGVAEGVAEEGIFSPPLWLRSSKGQPRTEEQAAAPRRVTRRRAHQRQHRGCVGVLARRPQPAHDEGDRLWKPREPRAAAGDRQAAVEALPVVWIWHCTCVSGGSTEGRVRAMPLEQLLEGAGADSGRSSSGGEVAPAEMLAMMASWIPSTSFGSRCRHRAKGAGAACSGSCPCPSSGCC